MNIFVLGGGKVGYALSEQLNREKHEVTLLDLKESVIERAVSAMDIQGVVGNASSYQVLRDAGVEDADLVIAVTDRDEISMLSCLIAKKAGRCSTIARVRNPVYYEEIRYLKEELGLAMAINPEYVTAEEIARLIQVPAAMQVSTFAKGRVNLIKVQITKDSPVYRMSLMELNKNRGVTILACYVERDGEVFIPNGRYVFEEGDYVAIVVPLWEMARHFKALGINAKPIRDVMIAGGGEISYYLAKRLEKNKIRIKIIEIDKEKCMKLSEELPNAVIIHGDASNQQLLLEEGIESTDAFVALTNIDEENVMISLYVNKVSKAKRIVKITRASIQELAEDLPVGSIVSPKNLTAQQIVRYVRAMQNSMGSNVEALSRMEEGRVEALEFIIRQSKEIDTVLGIPLSSLNFKDNLLICCINRNGRIITPTGRDVFQMHDSVIVVTTHTGLNDFMEIFQDERVR